MPTLAQAILLGVGLSYKRELTVKDEQIHDIASSPFSHCPHSIEEEADELSTLRDLSSKMRLSECDCDLVDARTSFCRVLIASSTRPRPSSKRACFRELDVGEDGARCKSERPRSLPA